MTEPERRYTVPDALLEVRGRKFRFDAVMHFKTSLARAAHTFVIYEELLALTLGVKKDAKLLTAQYLGIGISCVYKHLQFFEQCKKEGKIEELV